MEINYKGLKIATFQVNGSNNKQLQYIWHRASVKLRESLGKEKVHAHLNV